MSGEDKAWNGGRPRKWRRVKMRLKEKGGGAFGNPVLSFGASEGPTTAAGPCDTRMCAHRWKLRASLGLHRCTARWQMTHFFHCEAQNRTCTSSKKCAHNVIKTKLQKSRYITNKDFAMFLFNFLEFFFLPFWELQHNSSEPRFLALRCAPHYHLHFLSGWSGE